MKMEENSKNKRVEDILNSLDGMQPARANDFLFGKITSKISRPLTTRIIPLRTVSVAAASILLLLALNILLLSKRQQPRTSTDPIQQLVDYYGLNENRGI